MVLSLAYAKVAVAAAATCALVAVGALDASEAAEVLAGAGAADAWLARMTAQMTEERNLFILS